MAGKKKILSIVKKRENQILNRGSEADLTSDWIFSLRRGGRVCYLGWGSLAALGLVDASECNPTFGAGETRGLSAADADAPRAPLKCSCVCVRKPGRTSEASLLEGTRSWTTTRVLSRLWYAAEAPAVKIKKS